MTNSPSLQILRWIINKFQVLEQLNSHRKKKRVMALRAAVLRHVRVPVRFFALPRRECQPPLCAGGSLRLFSSHDDHLTKEEVIERVLSVIKCHPKVDPSKVSPDGHFQKDLGLDSLDTVEIVMALEEEFKLEIPDKEADKIDSCNLAIEYVYNHPMAS